MSTSFRSTTYSHVNRKIFEEIGTEFKYSNPPKIVLKLSDVMVGSIIGKKPFPDFGSRGPKGTGSRIRIRNTGE